jgi:hypothetical protein
MQWTVRKSAVESWNKNPTQSDIELIKVWVKVTFLANSSGFNVIGSVSFTTTFKLKILKL